MPTRRPTRERSARSMWRMAAMGGVGLALETRLRRWRRCTVIAMAERSATVLMGTREGSVAGVAKVTYKVSAGGAARSFLCVSVPVAWNAFVVVV